MTGQLYYMQERQNPQAHQALLETSQRSKIHAHMLFFRVAKCYPKLQFVNLPFNKIRGRLAGLQSFLECLPEHGEPTYLSRTFWTSVI